MGSERYEAGHEGTCVCTPPRRELSHAGLGRFVWSRPAAPKGRSPPNNSHRGTHRNAVPQQGRAVLGEPAHRAFTSVATGREHAIPSQRMWLTRRAVERGRRQQNARARARCFQFSYYTSLLTSSLLSLSHAHHTLPPRFSPLLPASPSTPRPL